jgi:hypothetical protein
VPWGKSWRGDVLKANQDADEDDGYDQRGNCRARIEGAEEETTARLYTEEIKLLRHAVDMDNLVEENMVGAIDTKTT